MDHLQISLPEGASAILDTLHDRGFEAYVVGGCVRDSILGRTPKDWDICTSATPGQVEEIFRDRRVIETGARFGTLTVCENDGQYEVTTFRTDGAYSDSRRPDSVEFVSDIREDLARRDFTINAMAYGPQGLVDPYGGARDLQTGIIRCVGDPDKRFQEDALRIMRALRFSAVYGFKIEMGTMLAIHRNVHLLERIAAERINMELCRTLCGRHALPVMVRYADVMSAIVPELKPCIGFDQHNRYHQYNVYEHMMRAMAYCGTDDLSVRLALFLHDIGKPQCYTEDERGGHFYGHAEISHAMAEVVLDRLKFDRRTRDAVLDLIKYHDSAIEPTEKAVCRWLNRIGAERFDQLLYVRQGDVMAHAEAVRDPALEKCRKTREILEDVLAREQCFSLKDLAVNGRDIMAMGAPEGKQVGEILNRLLDEVVSGNLENHHGVLIEAAGEMLAQDYAQEQETGLAQAVATWDEGQAADLPGDPEQEQSMEREQGSGQEQGQEMGLAQAVVSWDTEPEQEAATSVFDGFLLDDGPEGETQDFSDDRYQDREEADGYDERL